ncbi:hypothetical protein DPMN_077303 [Dreissena polymorpha]|uniref:Uncharacterized protein n=1 Tax=Dreissena polymorpha TaxID=45954 RepID=A0A9D3YP00_DREPO|nr:hypothetical protein DPMN_077303 [Dreissena polymorpha]
MTVTVAQNLAQPEFHQHFDMHITNKTYQGTCDRKYLVLIFNHSCKTSTRTCKFMRVETKDCSLSCDAAGKAGDAPEALEDINF